MYIYIYIHVYFVRCLFLSLSFSCLFLVFVLLCLLYFCIFLIFLLYKAHFSYNSLSISLLSLSFSIFVSLAIFYPPPKSSTISCRVPQPSCSARLLNSFVPRTVFPQTVFGYGHGSDTCHILPPSEIGRGQFLAVFTGSEGEYLSRRAG